MLPPSILASDSSERIRKEFDCNSWLIQKKGVGGRSGEGKEKERQCQKTKTHFSSSIKARCILGPVSRQLHNGNILESFFKRFTTVRGSKGQKVIIK